MRIFNLLIIILLISCSNSTNYGSTISNEIHNSFPETKDSLLYFVYYEDNTITYNLYIESKNEVSIIKYENNIYTNPLNESIPNNIIENIKKCNLKLDAIVVSPIDAIRKSNEEPTENTALFSIGDDCSKRWDIYNKLTDTMKVYYF